jgi:hypothetical protein
MFQKQSILIFLLSTFLASIMASSDPSMISMDHMVPVTFSDDFDYPFDLNNDYLEEEEDDSTDSNNGMFNHQEYDV